MELRESPIVTVGTTIILDISDPRRTHCFAGVALFNDADGDTVATPTAGSVAVAALTNVNPQAYEAASGSPIDVIVANRKQVSLAANPLKVRATPTGIAGATHYRLFAACNKT